MTLKSSFNDTKAYHKSHLHFYLKIEYVKEVKI